MPNYLERQSCPHCNRLMRLGNLARHEKICFHNQAYQNWLIEQLPPDVGLWSSTQWEAYRRDAAWPRIKRIRDAFGSWPRFRRWLRTKVPLPPPQPSKNRVPIYAPVEQIPDKMRWPSDGALSVLEPYQGSDGRWYYPLR